MILLDIDSDFKRFFPKLSFSLSELQKEAISSVVNHDNTLCIMTTGGGKSAIYWMAGVEMGGISIVISPLIALIDEQAQKIEEQGYETLVLHGGVDSRKQMDIMISFAKGEINPNFIFASPEKIATDGFFEFCIKQRKEDIKLIVIDEVHCVSQWGLSFRPFYKRIPNFLDAVFGSDTWPKILALTATLNPLELDDICSSFKISTEGIIKQEILMRTAIQLHVMQFITEDEKEERFWDLVKMHRDEKILIYLYRKKGDRGVEGLAQKALDLGYKAELFHGEMSAKERKEIIEKYKSNETKIVFATNAFGMGIDVPDIRVVIHFMIPESAEQYYQEVGRAARDGGGANAYLLYSHKNIEVKRTYFIDNSFPSEKKLREVYKNIGKKAGYRLLDYFDNEDIQQCLPYYVNCGLLSFCGKGFSGLQDLYEITDPILQQYYESTVSKGFVKTVKKNDITPDQLSETVYSAIFSEKAKCRKPLERWPIIQVHSTDISDEQMTFMLKEIEDKKKYKHDLLDYFVFLIEDHPNSHKLHQEIAKYLGMDKFHLERIYKTVDGNFVRSKSEVIISDLLSKAGISYKYEESIEYEPGKYICPDFTLYMEDGKVYYWEHVGMLGNEKYTNDWANKVDIYDEYYPDQLLRTYESGAIAYDADKIINTLLGLE